MKMIVFQPGCLLKKLDCPKMMLLIKKVKSLWFNMDQLYIYIKLYYHISVNYGNLLLQALLEHWWRPLHADDENEGSSNDSNGPIHTRGGNPYFAVPVHTPVIFR